MKTCKICNQNKELSEYRKYWSNIGNKHYYQSYCKKCQYEHYSKKQDRRDAVKKWRDKQHNGTWKVYTLPNHDYYVGYTKAIKPRMYRHKQKGKDYSDYIILHECNTEKDAKAYEKIYHEIGFPG